jgi:hypothetical protein
LRGERWNAIWNKGQWQPNNWKLKLQNDKETVQFSREHAQMMLDINGYIPGSRCMLLQHTQRRRRRPYSLRGPHNYLSKCNDDPYNQQVAL